MFRSCQEICRKIASDELAEAGLLERLMIRFHLWLCRDCSSYQEQLGAIGTSMRQLAHEESSTPSALERLEHSILESDSARSLRRADGAEADHQD